MTTLTTVLLGILGLGSMRSIEKVKRSAWTLTKL
jgi:Tfp pilus assembly protein PilX